MDSMKLSTDHEASDEKCQISVVQKISSYVRRELQLILLFLGVVVGFVLGFAIRPAHPSEDALLWLGIPGEMFLRMLRMLILPLIICSVISGTATLGPRSNGKITVVALGYSVATNTIASAISVILYIIVKPASGKTGNSSGDNSVIMETQDIFADLIRNVIPDNMVEATFRQAQTKYKLEEVNQTQMIGNVTEWVVIDRIVKHLGQTESVNVLGLIVMCMVIGIAASTLKEKADVFLKFFTAGTDIVFIILRKLFWIAPIGIASLIAVSIAKVANLASTFLQLGMLVVTITVAITIHTFIVLPIILFILTRRNPLHYYWGLLKAYMVAFAAASSAAAVPETISACESRHKIDGRVARFVMPFCTAVNADNSGIYIASAAIFVAQLAGTVTTREIIIIGVLSAVSAMAIPSVPSASIVTLIIILTSLGIPANQVALLFSVEWFLDRLRSAGNVFSHAICAAVTYHFCKVNLKPNESETELLKSDKEIILDEEAI